jgi:hypothetical protein
MDLNEFEEAVRFEIRTSERDGNVKAYVEAHRMMAVSATCIVMVAIMFIFV